MKRKEVLNTIYVSGICACSGSILFAEETDNSLDNRTAQNEDWHIHFSKTRYSKLMEILQTKLSKDEFSEIIQMPEMDGFEATKFIPEKEENNERHIPIVAMMANAI